MPSFTRYARTLDHYYKEDLTVLHGQAYAFPFSPVRVKSITL